MKKRILAVICVVALVGAMATACGNKESKETNAANQDLSELQEQVQEALTDSELQEQVQEAMTNEELQEQVQGALTDEQLQEAMEQGISMAEEMMDQ